MKKISKIILSLFVLIILFSCEKKGGSLNMTEIANIKYNELLKRNASITKNDDPELESILNNFLYGEIYNYGTLDPKLRELVTLVSLTAVEGTSMIKYHIDLDLIVG